MSNTHWIGERPDSLMTLLSKKKKYQQPERFKAWIRIQGLGFNKTIIRIALNHQMLFPDILSEELGISNLYRPIGNSKKADLLCHIRRPCLGLDQWINDHTPSQWRNVHPRNSAGF
ncbi:hypothetical protein TNCV_4427841 [Trichonephila clavipes]|nr:hypothetical protein TNCV_4427841 [Trichonephila clavipes]